MKAGLGRSTGCRSQEGATAHPGVLNWDCTGWGFARVLTFLPHVEESNKGTHAHCLV